MSVAALSWRLSSALPSPFEMAFIATLKNPHPQPLSTMLVAMVPPLVGIRAVFNHHIAFVVVIVVAIFKVFQCVVIVVSQPRGRQMKDDALVVIFDVFQNNDEFSSSEGGMTLH